MKLLIWKKAAVLGLLFSMTMSLTACGEKKENNGLNSENSNLDCFFSSEDIDMSAVKGTNIYAFESYMKTQTATEPYTDEYGRSITPNYMNAFSEGDVQIDYSPLSPDEEKLYRDLVNTTTKIRGDNEEVVNIICEEAGAYFAGQKSLDETADIIQNRVTNYVNEIR